MTKSPDDKTSLVRQSPGAARSGDRIAGRFAIVKPLYRANTFQARDGKHHVRIEIMPADIDVVRLRAAVAAASTLAHPNICRIREFVEADGACVIAMELVDGVSLRDRLLLGALDPVQAVEWLGQVLSALACGHAAGIAHGDVSAANVVIDATGTLKLLDFGIVRDEGASPQADLRAVGALAYAMLTGDTGPVRIPAVSEGYRAWVRRCTGAFPFVDAKAAAAALHEGPKPDSRMRIGLAVAAGAVAIGAIAFWASRGGSNHASEPIASTSMTASSAPVYAEVEPIRRRRPPLPTGAIEPNEHAPPVAIAPIAPITPTELPPSAPALAQPAPPPKVAPSVEAGATLAQIAFPAEAGWIVQDMVFVLEEVYAHLLKNPLVRVEVGGHSSTDGKDDDKQRIALWRANSVRDYLLKRGIDAKRIEVHSYGDSKPVAPNDTADGRAKNRRVEIRVLTTTSR